MTKRIFLALLLSAAFCLPLFVAADNPTYWPPAIGDFDGTNDYLSRGSDLIGCTDGKVGLVSFWFRKDGGDGAFQFVIRQGTSRFGVTMQLDNAIRVIGKNTSNAAILRMDSSEVTSDATWHHFMSSWDLSDTAKRHIYLDGTADLQAVGFFTNDNIDYTAGNVTIGADVTPDSLLDGALSEFYFAAEYLDISVSSNLAKFIDASGYPVDLGWSGYKPTGTAPIIYMKTQFNNAGFNSGTGGHFTINGAPIYSVGPIPFFTTPSAGGSGRGRHR